MRKQIGRAAFCSFILCVFLCGCGESDVIWLGETEEGISTFAGGETEYMEPVETEICVYVCGAVNAPGLVRLPEGSRAADALEKAGGFREDAGTDSVNLAARVSDGEKLYFPTAEEAVSREQAGGGLIDINTADAGQLCTLPGIGESRAADIIAYREANGSFESCEDIMKVSGIKKSVYEKIKDKITVK